MSLNTLREPRTAATPLPQAPVTTATVAQSIARLASALNSIRRAQTLMGRTRPQDGAAEKEVKGLMAAAIDQIRAIEGLV